MNKTLGLVKTTLLGGVVVILPVAIMLFVAKWLFATVAAVIHPLTALVDTRTWFGELFVNLLVVAIIVFACFLVGVFVRTRLGALVYRFVEKRFLRAIPGYSLTKETVVQFLGDNKSPFSSVALVQIFGNETLVSAFVTDTHDNGDFTVFVPTGPNPTSGNIYHLKSRFVHPVDVPVEEAMRSIISCGAGSAGLIRAYAND
jgi:uncharacterized membrane protein